MIQVLALYMASLSWHKNTDIQVNLFHDRLDEAIGVTPIPETFTLLLYVPLPVPQNDWFR